jgi:nitrite reductase/ring-hydroxylating ferredoxin subunit
LAEYKLGININDLKDDTPVTATAGGKVFAVVKVDGKLHVLDGICTHQGGPLGEGSIDDGELICPWHSGAYDIETGKADEDTHWVTDINVYRARVDSTSGDIYVEF